jgi:hypothetical protein
MSRFMGTTVLLSDKTTANVALMAMDMCPSHSDNQGTYGYDSKWVEQSVVRPRPPGRGENSPSEAGPLGGFLDKKEHLLE